MIAGEKPVQLHAVGEQAPQCRRVDQIILRDHPCVGVVASVFEDGLVRFRQCIPFVEIDER